MSQEKLITIELQTKELTRKDDGKTFIAYKGLTKKGWYDLKFTQDVKDAPNHGCKILVKQEDVNINRAQKFPVIWVKKIQKVEEYNFEQKVADYFD